jgi:Cof subfamily protein (haloacid dehalogenase superfamily)
LNFTAIVLDLDGTLLNTQKKISTLNINAILDCHKSGIKIIFATARPPRAVNELLPKVLSDIGSFVFYNGALIASTPTSAEVHFPIALHISNELIDYCVRNHQDIEISLEVKDEWYSLSEIDYSVIMRRRGKPIKKDLKELKEFIPTKILITSIKDYSSIVDKFSNQLNIVVTDNGKLMQVMSKEASKEKGVQFLCNQFGINMNQVIVFGDDYNDFGLFEISGYSVAMGNAVDELKRIADEITLTNDEDGVGEVLERIMKVQLKNGEIESDVRAE